MLDRIVLYLSAINFMLKMDLKNKFGRVFWLSYFILFLCVVSPNLFVFRWKII